MLCFEPFSFESLKKYLPWIRRSPYRSNDLSAGSLFMWTGEDDGLSFCVWNDTFMIRRDIAEQAAFTWPYGKDPEGMIGELIAYVHENDLPLRFFFVDEEALAQIRRDGRFGSVLAGYDDKWSDYIYSYEDASTFHGRRFSGQRNHVNRFRKLYGEPQIRLLTPEDLPAVRAFLDMYQGDHPDMGYLERLELASTRRLLECYGELDQYAACLTVDGEIAALSIGEVLGDMLDIHVEKALRRYEGAYPTMYQGFSALVGSLCTAPLSIVNREDDCGDLGIRTSKQQYHPIRMERKYLVYIDSPAAGITLPELRADHVVLTGIREGDKAAYLRLNIDVENNEMWGYDYREDIGISGEPDEETFYSGAMLDQAVGDSLNFAVRLTEDGEMIGETILWHFTSNGYAEIGCRLFPEYQGKGYGREAFAATADYAQQVLGLKPRAKCFLANAASYRMITGSGFRETGKDEEYYYFER